MTDVPTLSFVDPDEVDATYRCCLFAAGGSGKSVAAASAPTPILVLSADRPTAYKFARKHHGHTKDDLREFRYVDAFSLDALYQYLAGPNGAQIKTLVVDPVTNVVDQLVETAPKTKDGETDYQAVNRKMLGFIKSLRRFDINVVLVAYEKCNDGKKGDGRIYPHIGGMGLINKVIGEMDFVAHIERHVREVEDGEPEEIYVGQIQPRDNLVCKDGTNALGARRIADLSRWFEVASEYLAPDNSDIPFDKSFKPAVLPENEQAAIDKLGDELGAVPA
jgi:hypothetical protein